jgi:hypothetical protein
MTQKRLIDLPKHIKGVDSKEAARFAATLPPAERPDPNLFCRGKFVVVKTASNQTKA